MPRAYRKQWSAAQIEEHARLVAFGKDAVRVKRCLAGASPGESLICVVVDDRAGLLAILSYALAVNGLDVRRAKAYTRVRPDQGPQAVDFFWVRSSGSDITVEDGALPGIRCESSIDERIRQFEITLKGLLFEGRREDLSLLDLSTPERKSTQYETRVRFVEDAAGGLAVLEVETGDRLGLLFCLAHALHAEGVNINSAEVTTVEGRVVDRFGITELGGGAIDQVRRLTVQVAVLAAILPAPAVSN